MKPDERRFPAPPNATQYAISFALDPQVMNWIEHELFGERVALRIAQTVRDVVAALLEEPPPRPQIAIVDFDALTRDQVLDLHRIREGWSGRLIALGTVSDDLRSSLHIEHVLKRPLGSEALRKAIGSLGLDERPTTRISKLK